MRRKVIIVAVAAIFCCAVIPPVVSHAQPLSTDPTIHSLRQDMDELIRGQIELQKQLQELKVMMASNNGNGACGQPQTPAVNFIFDTAGSPVKGDAQAAVTMIEFADYQCPFCARFNAATFPQLDRDFIKTGKVKYVLRNFPLENLHPFALKAAEALRCTDGGDTAWALREWMLTNQVNLTAESFVQFAQQTSLVTNTFDRCLQDGKVAAAVQAEAAEAGRVGVTGTPTFFLGLTDPAGTKIKVVKIIIGDQPYAEFKTAVENLLAGAKTADGSKQP